MASGSRFLMFGVNVFSKSLNVHFVPRPNMASTFWTVFSEELKLNFIHASAVTRGLSGMEGPGWPPGTAGLPCALTNPRTVRRFAEAMGRLEKTDRIDAEVIARHAEARRIRPTQPPSEQQQRLTALAARLRQVTGDLSVQKQRLHAVRDPGALASLKQAITFFTGQARELAAEIATLVEHDPVWAALDRTFRSVKGVAGRTVAVLLAELPEIGTLSNKAISKLAGLAPIANDSGKRSGPRSIRGGRTAVRSILFLVADVARKYDPSLAEFRQRLLDQGKPKMVVRIALAHKLLVRLNAKARETRLEITT